VAAFDLFDFVLGLNDSDLGALSGLIGEFSGVAGALSGVAGAFSGVAGLILRVLNFDFIFDFNVWNIYIVYLFYFLWWWGDWGVLLWDFKGENKIDMLNSVIPIYSKHNIYGKKLNDKNIYRERNRNKFYYSITLYVGVLFKVKFLYNTCGEIISMNASNLDVRDVVNMVLYN
jgi:hypothetical protein